MSREGILKLGNLGGWVTVAMLHKLSPSAIKVWVALCSIGGSETCFEAPVDRIAYRSKVHRRHIATYVRELTRNGHVSVRHRRRAMNVYTLHRPLPQAERDKGRTQSVVPTSKKDKSCPDRSCRPKDNTTQENPRDGKSVRRESNPQVKTVIDYFCRRYRELRGEPYLVSDGRDGKLIKELLGTFDEPTIHARIDSFLASPADKWVLEQGWSILAFRHRFNGLGGKIPSTFEGPSKFQEILRSQNVAS
jgi:hypothetical protein